MFIFIDSIVIVLLAVEVMYHLQVGLLVGHR